MTNSNSQALIVLAHPEPRSFNAQLAGVAAGVLREAGYDVVCSDLYGRGFDPVEGPRHYENRSDGDWFRPQAEQRHASETRTLPADVAEEIERLRSADLVIFQYPMWWYGPPGILKGWFDRVFAYGELYDSNVRYDAGVFRGKRALVSVTMGAPEATYELNGRNGDIELVLWPVHFTLHYLGYSVLPPFLTYSVQGGIAYTSESEMLAELERAKTQFAKYIGQVAAGHAVEPIRFNGWDDWDEEGRLREGAEDRSAFIRKSGSPSWMRGERS
jgi:NAD(P)H dehydrogenase (quinone)